MNCGVENTFLELLRCPSCHQELSEEPACSSTLKCVCGRTYPVIDAVPRLLENAEPEPTSDLAAVKSNSRKQNDFDYIRQSFSKEWGVFDYDADKTWGWTLDERKRIFLADVGRTAAELEGKLLLDAGCGNGTLTAALAVFGMDIVGMDLNDRLGDANLNKDRKTGERSGRIHFVQGNLFNPPLKHDSFDLIYCSGVIHHTPSSKGTFKSLVPLVKRGGRLYVWVYGKRSIPVRVLGTSGRQLKRFISLGSLLTVCKAVAPFYKVATEALNALGIAEFRKRKAREITLDIFDSWAPKYNYWHKEEEVQSWFREMGFENITISGKQKHGFGCYGDKL